MRWGNAFRVLYQLKNAARFVRDVRSDNVLSYVGLQKKHSAFAAYVLPGIGVFAAGLAAGAGLGLMLAPKSGRELRGQLGHRYSSVKDKLASTTEPPRSQVSSAGSQLPPTVQPAPRTASAA
jgi:hypothetical protein